MAQTQTNTSVKFHSISKANYNGLGTQGGQGYDPGALYFIKDNGEIRKGEKHITGTRVYTAVDSTNGTTPIASLRILLDGSAPGQNDQPKKGDILIVDQTIKAADGTNPAIYAKAAYAHDGNGWVACDGNVDASKVILTSDITMAGEYEQVGNLTKLKTGTKTFETQGISVAEALQTIFTKKLQPIATQPAVTLTLTNASQSLEVGTTSSIPTFSATLSSGSYTYGPETGVTATGWSVTDGTNTYTTSSGNLPTIKASDASQSYDVTATASHGAGATPKDNLGGTATVAGIAAGDKSARKTVTVTGYRKWFYGVDRGDGTGTIDSAFIRGLTSGGNCETSTEVTITAGDNAKRIVVAVPQKNTSKASLNAAKKLVVVKLASFADSPFVMNESGTFDPTAYNKMTPVNVRGYDQTDSNSEIPYDVWVYQPASIKSDEKHTFVIG